MSVLTKRLGPTAGLALCCLALCSCGEQESFRKETFPLTGEVYVDDKPAGQVQVTCHNVAGIDAEHPTFSRAITDEEGKFSISTYESADGLPEGEYVLTFMWGKIDLLKGGYSGPDKLGERYQDPKTSKFRVTVEPGKETEVQRIELTAK